MDINWSVEQKRTAKELFGRPLRVVLAAWILDRQGEPFFLLEAQDAMREADEVASNVSRELRRFVDHGMLTTFQDARRLYFTQVSSPFWGAFEAIAASVGLVDLAGP